jgi:hypothetical protein
MIIDSLAEFANSQTVTGGSTTVATSDIDLGVARNIGSGKPLYVNIVIESATAGDGSDTFAFTLVGDTALPIDGSSVAIAAYPTITGVANVAAGTKLCIPVPPGTVAAYRYLGLRYATTADAVLVVSAWLSDTPIPDHQTYADATDGVTV